MGKPKVAEGSLYQSVPIMSPTSAEKGVPSHDTSPEEWANLPLRIFTIPHFRAVEAMVQGPAMLRQAGA